METTDVVIAGAGPTGLMLAGELRLAGVDVVLLDALPARTGESRAGGIHARTMEIFDQRGLLERLRPQGQVIQAGHFGGVRMDFSDFPTRFPYTLAVLQSVIERELDQYATELGAPVRWSSRVLEIRQDGDGVEVETDSGVIRCAYVVGCDGGRSTVRKLAGIRFEGTDATMVGMLADVELADPPSGTVFGQRRDLGDYSVIQFQPGWHRLMVQRYDRVLDRAHEPTFEDFRDSFREIVGTDYGMHSPRWVTQFGDAARQADRYRVGRVLLAGDAAHIHFPAGGQGLNTGVQDAFNLGWKLAAVVQGRASGDLLDTYEAERFPVAARVLHNTRAQTALSRPGSHADALRDTFTGLLEIDDVRFRLGLMITALDVRYDLKDDHPLTGRRVPDADVTVAGAATRIHRLLTGSRPVLLTFGASVAGVDCVQATCAAEHWTVPGVGEIDRPAAVLIRPDGYVAWAGDGDGLEEALATWAR